MSTTFDFSECITIVLDRAVRTGEPYRPTEMEEWVEAHGGRLDADKWPAKIVFKNKDDAFAFKMRWL